MAERIAKPMSFRAPRVLFWTALAVRLLVILIGHTYHIRIRDDHWEFGYEAGRLARSMVTGQGFSSPFNGPSGPSAWLGPLFPGIMALGFKLFGVYTNAAALFTMAVNSVFSALTVPAVYEIAARCFDAYGIGRRASTKAAPVALWSGWIFALHPETIQFPIHWLWEMTLSTCIFAWTLVFALRLRRIGEPETTEPKPTRWGTWAAFGLFWGLQSLSNASLMSTMPFVLLWILWPSLWRKRQQLAQTVAGAVLCCVVTGAVMTPWIIRNERVFHAFVPTRSNLGVELWNATEWFHGPLPYGAAISLSPTDPEFKLYAQMGEVRYSQIRMKQAKERIHEHPGRYWRDTAMRVQFFWFIWPHALNGKPVSEALRLFNYGLLSVTGLFGLALALRRRVPGAWMMFWVFLLVPIPYYLVTIQARFRYPIEPLICVVSVYLFRATQQRRARLSLDA